MDRISNPLGGIPKDVLMADVESFAEETGLTEHTAMLKKGALVAQNPGTTSILPVFNTWL
jgi:hypothetical protein